LALFLYSYKNSFVILSEHSESKNLRVSHQLQ
jgi:hypothetical protein